MTWPSPHVFVFACAVSVACHSVPAEPAVTCPEGFVDADGDGHGAGPPTERCEATAGYVDNDDDCNDTDPNIFPGSPELCDGIDNDCSLVVDDGLAFSDYAADADADGFGDPDTLVSACAQPDGHVLDTTDCDDSSAMAFPGGVEVCDNLDNDCDGFVDLLPHWPDLDLDGFGDIDAKPSPIGICTTPPEWVLDATDCNDDDPLIFPGSAELCDRVDNNCDGTADEGLGPDADSDGETCLDCNDNDPNVYLGAPDTYGDGIDTSCNGLDGPGFVDPFLTEISWLNWAHVGNGATWDYGELELWSACTTPGLPLDAELQSVPLDTSTCNRVSWTYIARFEAVLSTEADLVTLWSDDGITWVEVDRWRPGLVPLVRGGVIADSGAMTTGFRIAIASESTVGWPASCDSDLHYVDDFRVECVP